MRVRCHGLTEQGLLSSGLHRYRGSFSGKHVYEVTGHWSEAMTEASTRSFQVSSFYGFFPSRLKETVAQEVPSCPQTCPLTAMRGRSYRLCFSDSSDWKLRATHRSAALPLPTYSQRKRKGEGTPG